VESDRSNALAAAHRPGSTHDGPDERLADIRRAARQCASDGHHDRTIAAGKPGVPFAIFTMMRSAFGNSQVARESDDRVPDIARRPAHAPERRRKRHSLAWAVTWRCRDWLPREEITEVMGADAV
jgi:hypothetical protein